MPNPKVTVLMSVYNGEKYLREAVDSILNQTFNDFEFLIANDSSTDNTAEILESYKDPRIKVVNNGKNIGLTKSLNKGLRIARGKYIARMDADDISMPDRLEKQMAVMKKDPGLGLVASWITVINEKRFPILAWWADRKNNTPEEIYYTLCFENCVAHSSVLFRKDAVLKIGGYNESFRKSQDYELWTRLSKTAKMAKIREALVVRREHYRNKSAEVVNQHRADSERLFLKNVNELLPTKFDSDVLYSIKHKNFAGKTESYIQKVKEVQEEISRALIKSAPSFLDKAKLEKCGERKERELLKNPYLILLPKVIGTVYLNFRALKKYIRGEQN